MPNPIVETVTTHTFATNSGGYLKLYLKSAHPHKIEVSNGSKDQRESAWGWTELDGAALNRLYDAIGEHLGLA